MLQEKFTCLRNHDLWASSRHFKKMKEKKTHWIKLGGILFIFLGFRICGSLSSKISKVFMGVFFCLFFLFFEVGLKTLQTQTDSPEISPQSLQLAQVPICPALFYQRFCLTYRDRDLKKRLETPLVPLSLADIFPTPHNRGFSMDLIQRYTVSIYKQTLLYLHKVCIQKSEERESQVSKIKLKYITSWNRHFFMGLKAGLSSGDVTLCQGNGWDPCLLLARITISNMAI